MKEIHRFDEKYFKSLKTMKEKQDYYLSYVHTVLDKLYLKEKEENSHGN